MALGTRSVTGYGLSSPQGCGNVNPDTVRGCPCQLVCRKVWPTELSENGQTDRDVLNHPLISPSTNKMGTLGSTIGSRPKGSM